MKVEAALHTNIDRNQLTISIRVIVIDMFILLNFVLSIMLQCSSFLMHLSVWIRLNGHSFILRCVHDVRTTTSTQKHKHVSFLNINAIRVTPYSTARDRKLLQLEISTYYSCSPWVISKKSAISIFIISTKNFFITF